MNSMYNVLKIHTIIDYLTEFSTGITIIMLSLTLIFQIVRVKDIVAVVFMNVFIIKVIVSIRVIAIYCTEYLILL
jgi:hypothetical protein